VGVGAAGCARAAGSLDANIDVSDPGSAGLAAGGGAGGGIGKLGFELNTAAGGGGSGGIIGLATLLVVGPSMACNNCVRLDAAAGDAGAGTGAGGVTSFEPMSTSKPDPDATGGGAGATGLWSSV
jgi:hypothetical protein